jgi:hypothetical protein
MDETGLVDPRDLRRFTMSGSKETDHDERKEDRRELLRAAATSIAAGAAVALVLTALSCTLNL